MIIETFQTGAEVAAALDALLDVYKYSDTVDILRVEQLLCAWARLVTTTINQTAEHRSLVAGLGEEVAMRLRDAIGRHQPVEPDGAQPKL